MLVSCADDGQEIGLEGGTSNKESIDVLLSDQISSVLTIDGSSVLNADSLSDFLGDILRNPSSNVLVGSLSNLWGGGLTSADGPNWLVGKHDSAPVGNRVLQGIELALQVLVGFALLSLFKTFTEADHGTESYGLSSSNLGSNLLVCLIKESAPLGVSDDDPLKIEVLELLSTDFSGEGTVAGLAHVLAGNLDFIVEQGLDRSDMDADWSNNDFKLGLVEVSLVEDIVDEVFGALDSAIALPVSTNDHFSLCGFHVIYFIRE